MPYQPNHFKQQMKEPAPIKGLNWVLEEATVRITTTEQRQFIDSTVGQMLMDSLRDAKDRASYLKTAAVLETAIAARAYSFALGNP